jgi:hypothetical protein
MSNSAARAIEDALRQARGGGYLRVGIYIGKHADRPGTIEAVFAADIEPDDDVMTIALGLTHMVAEFLTAAGITPLELISADISRNAGMN